MVFKAVGFSVIIYRGIVDCLRLVLKLLNVQFVLEIILENI